MSSIPELQHGYYSGSGDTFNAYPEYFPNRLRLLALLRGQRPPALEGPFRLIEFGCGQGVGLCLMAAVHPQAHFHGIDLLPVHISHARALAAAADLDNVIFEEADLLDLASPQVASAESMASADSGPPASVASGEPIPAAEALAPTAASLEQTEPTPPSSGSYDIAIAHGVLSWVSREVQQALWKLATSSLRPGGLFAISYNTFPGQLSQVPFQHLVRSLQETLPSGPACLDAAVALSQKLRQQGSGLFAAQPGLGAFLDALPNQNPAYLPHEYNQQRWQPRFADAVIRSANQQGFSYLGSATLPESFDGLLPESFRALVREQGDPAMAELVRDLLTNQSFRRDVYGRGLDPLWAKEAERALLAQPIIRLVVSDQLDQPDLYTFNLSFGSVQGRTDWFRSFMDHLGEQPRPLGELLSTGSGLPIPLPELLQNLALLLSKGLVALVSESVDPVPAQRLNRVIAQKVRDGAPYRFLAAPLIGSALPFSDLDFLALDASLRGISGLALPMAVAAGLDDLQRGIEREGRTITAADRTRYLREHADHFQRRMLPLLQRLGAVA